MVIEKYALDIRDTHINTAGAVSTNVLDKLRSELSSNMFSDYLIDVDLAVEHTEDCSEDQAVVILQKPSDITPSELRRGLKEHRFVTGVEWLED
jgi:hypothetical protein